MGLFSFFNKKNATLHGMDLPGTPPKMDLPPVSEEIFTEKTPTPAEVNTQASSDKSINLLFDFLDRNHETQGYDAALTNPDAIHLEQNLQSLTNELTRTIRKVKTYYEDFIKEINFHIESRSRSGMIDTVDELRMKKEIAESHIKKILEIEEDSRDGRGDSQGVLMSYTRGFKNGLAAISHHSIIKIKIQ